MNQSKYNPKLDPKSSSYQPNAKLASVEVPTSPAAQAVNAQPAAVASIPQAAVLNHDEVEAEKIRQDAKAHYQGPAAVVQAVAAVDEKSESAMISEGGNTASGDMLHAVREPSALTGDLPPVIEAVVASEGGETAPVISAKTLS